eukprot:2121734-Rhodomonas_salina.4
MLLPGREYSQLFEVHVTVKTPVPTYLLPYALPMQSPPLACQPSYSPMHLLCNLRRLHAPYCDQDRLNVDAMTQFQTHCKGLAEYGFGQAVKPVLIENASGIVHFRLVCFFLGVAHGVVVYVEMV